MYACRERDEDEQGKFVEVHRTYTVKKGRLLWNFREMRGNKLICYILLDTYIGFEMNIGL